MFPITKTRDFHGFFVKSFSVGLYCLLQLLSNCEQAIRSLDDFPLRWCRNFCLSSLKSQMDRWADKASWDRAESRKELGKMWHNSTSDALYILIKANKFWRCLSGSVVPLYRSNRRELNLSRTEAFWYSSENGFYNFQGSSQRRRGSLNFIHHSLLRCLRRGPVLTFAGRLLVKLDCEDNTLPHPEGCTRLLPVGFENEMAFVIFRWDFINFTPRRHVGVRNFSSYAKSYGHTSYDDYGGYDRDNAKYDYYEHSPYDCYEEYHHSYDMQEHQGVVTRAKAKQLKSHKDQIEQEKFEGLDFDVQGFMGLKF
ncbi:hypothetical protein M9H77_29463 [Catharanthus roseus]|uniref:Uncharacterized protein n=1 Tax=Catharanthus roseus TaxID=4058 RepID=A0ACB9ZYC3_CATRO|nr:hypothetical protein M9H77_29463 [Catharanthus roseus]